MASSHRPLIRDPERLAALRRNPRARPAADPALDRLSRLAARVCGTPVALVALVDEDHHLLPGAAGLREPWASRREMPLDRFFAQHVLEAPGPVVVGDARRDERLRGTAALEEDLMAVVAVPLYADGHAIGALCALDHRTRVWSEAEVAGLAEVAALVEREFDHACAEQAHEGHLDWLRNMVELQQAITGARLDLDAVLAETAERVRLLTGADASAVELADEDEMVYRAASGTAEPLRGLRLPFGGSLSALCLATGGLLRSDDTAADGLAEREACRITGARSFLLAPLLRHGRVVGGLFVCRTRRAAFSVPHARSLELAGGLLATALADAQTAREEQELRTALRRSRDRYRHVFNEAQDGFFLVERDSGGEFRYRDVNPRLAKITGVTIGDFVGCRPTDLFAAETAERIQHLYASVYESGEAADVLETVLLPRGEASMRTRLHPIPRPEGGVEAILGIIEDVTERIRAEKALAAYSRELERSNRDLSDFAFIASHDLQEPLRKVQAFGDRLAARYGAVLDETGRDYLTRMQGAAARMQVLIQDLLAYSRAATQPRSLTSVRLEELVAAAVQDLSERVETSGGRVHVGSLPMVEGDPLQLRQVFQNLIGNALKFHRPGVPPEVWVRGDAVDDVVEVRVRDQGIGFEAEYAETIFRPFERLHGRTEYEGTGMGLAIVRRIVERHGGHVRAEATPGAGTTFVIQLPQRQSTRAEM